jgi:hypothetical protein
MQGHKVKNKGLESNAQKQRVREDIFNQVKAFNYTSSNKYRPLDIFTLPGERCILEKMFYEYYRDPSLHTILSIDCAEHDKDKIPIIKSNLPYKADVKFGSADDVICGAIRVGDLKEYDVMWLDFTRPANPVLIEQVAKYAALALKNKGLLYVTFYIKGIKCKTGSKMALIDLATSGTVIPHAKEIRNREASNEEVKNVVISELMRAFKRQKVKMKKIYDVIYGGGSRYNTSMVTLGFSKNILKKDENYVKLIREDRLKTERRKKRILQKKSAQKSKRDMIFTMLDNNIPDDSIKHHCEINTTQLAAYKAHYNKKGLPWRIKEREEVA